MTAYWLWILLSLFAFFASIYLLLSCLNFSPKGKFLLAASASAFEPTFHNFYWGNISSFVLLLTVLFFRYLNSKNFNKAGCCLALLMVKPELFLVIAIISILKFKNKLLIPYIFLGAILLLISLIIVRFDGFLDYIKLNIEAAKSYTEAQTEANLRDMINWRGFFVRNIRATFFADFLAIIYIVISIALLFYIWFKRKPPYLGINWTITLILSLMIAPHVHLQSLILVFPAAVINFWDKNNYDYLLNDSKFYALLLLFISISWLPIIYPMIGRTIIQLFLILSVIICLKIDYVKNINSQVNYSIQNL